MFGENLKTLRKQKEFSQEELATRLHVVNIGWNDRNSNEEDCSLWERFRNRPGFAAGCGSPGSHP